MASSTPPLLSSLGGVMRFPMKCLKSNKFKHMQPNKYMHKNANMYANIVQNIAVIAVSHLINSSNSEWFILNSSRFCHKANLPRASCILRCLWRSTPLNAWATGLDRPLVHLWCSRYSVRWSWSRRDRWSCPGLLQRPLLLDRHSETSCRNTIRLLNGTRTHWANCWCMHPWWWYTTSW